MQLNVEVVWVKEKGKGYFFWLDSKDLNYEV